MLHTNRPGAVCRTFAVFIAVFVLAAVGALDAPAREFSFIHISDEHIYHSGTPETIAELNTPSPVLLKPYNVTAPAPSFMIETGDMTEIGPKAGAWNKLEELYSTVPLPRYSMLGNHDGTWRSLSYELTQRYGAPYYSFDHAGCHFVVLNSPGLQDPRPTLGPEQLAWLKADLTKINASTPLFIALHHPLDSSEFSSRYEVERFMDVLRPYNVALVMVGHSHAFKHTSFDGVDMVHGGSAWGPGLAGYQVVSISGDNMCIAYKERGKPEAETAILTKSIAPPAKPYPVISISSPIDRATYAATVPVKAWIRLGEGEVKAAYVEIDGVRKAELVKKSGGSYDARINGRNLAPGAHYMRVSFEALDGSIYHRSCSFYITSSKPAVRWRSFMDAASKSTPTFDNNTVYVGGYDGSLRAFDITTGKLKWQFATTGGAVAGEAVVLDGRVYFGSEDRHVYCVSAADGKQVWRFEADEPVYCSLVTDGSSIYFGTGCGTFYSIAASDGALKWKNTDATYCIESKAFIAGDRVYYGSWDTYVYCLNTADGSMVWKCMGQGSAEGTAPAYYSPADCGPVVAGGRVFVADRKYRMSVIDAASGKLERFVDKVSAVGLSEDGNSLYLRKTDKTLVKTDLQGSEIWSVDVSMDEVPAAPFETGGVVYVSSKRGLVSAVSAADGSIEWQYQATPSSYILSSIGASDKAVYVSGTDGSVTALQR